MSPFYRAKEFNSVPALNCKTTNSVNFHRRVAPPHLLCVLYTAHYTRLQFTVIHYTVQQCTVLHCTVHSVHSAQHILLCTQHTAQCALCVSHCTMCSVHITLHNSLCTRHTVQCRRPYSVLYNNVYMRVQVQITTPTPPYSVV